MHICRRVRLGQNNLVCFGFLLAVVKYAFASTVFRLPEWCDILLMLTAMSCFVLHIILKQIKGKQFLIFLLAMAVAGIVYLNNGYDDDLIVMVIAVYALKDIDYDKLIKSYSAVIVLFFTAIVGYSLWTGEHLGRYLEYRVERGYEYRYMFGFIHPNSLQGMYMQLVCGLLLCSWGKHRKSRKYILLEIINLLFFLFSNSRTGLLVVTIVLFICFISDWMIKQFGRKAFLHSISILNVGVIAFTIFASVCYKNFDFLKRISSLVTGRFDYANRFLTRFPICLFGREIIYKNKYGYELILDCGIIDTLLHCGLIVFMVSVAIYLLGIKQMWEDCNYTGMIVVTGYLIYSMLENVYFSIFINFGLVLCCYYVSNTKRLRRNRSVYEYLIDDYRYQNGRFNKHNYSNI